MYAIIGMEIFGGLVEYYPPAENATDGNSSKLATWCGGHEELNNTEFSELQYCKNNFNDVVHSFVVLFDLMVVNQWHGYCVNELVQLGWSLLLCIHSCYSRVCSNDELVCKDLLPVFPSYLCHFDSQVHITLL